MSNSGSIHIKDACKIIYDSQQLSIENNYESKTDLFKIIDKLGYLQIDTISVVERSHHHILWSRMPLYKKEMLDELIEKDKLVFEYWSHAASFLPMSDYRFSLIRKRNFIKKTKTWGSANKRIIKMVFDRIKAEGPMMSRDFDDKRNGNSGWWNWKPSKDALDHLFHSGKLMIAKRKGFQKVYDLTEKVLPDFADCNMPSESEYYKHLISRSVNSNGIIRQNEILYLRKYDKNIFEKVLNEMIEDQIILKIKIIGIDDGIFYSTKSNLEILNSNNPKKKFNILSPFDNIVIQRKRLKELFNFDYQLECYVPQSKRKHGYFCLPVMFGDRFIGKIDAKAHREKNTFVLINRFMEEGVELNSGMNKSFLKKIMQLAKFTNCTEVKVL